LEGVWLLGGRLARTKSVTQQILLIVLGWALGLLAGPVTEWIRKSRTRKDVARALTIELTELRDQTATIPYSVWRRQGEITDDRLNWTMRMCGKSGNEDCRQLKSELEQLLTLPESHRAAVYARAPTGGNSVAAKSIEAPFLVSRLQDLSLFSNSSSWWRSRATSSD
jgi:hypothetical protein